MENRNGHDGAWEKLGTLLKQRRALLNPRWRNRRAFAEDAGLSYRMIFDIEENRRTNFTTVTLTALEVAYQFKPGAIAAFLDGGELAHADEPAHVARVVPFPLSDVTAQLGPRPAGVSRKGHDKALEISREVARLAGKDRDNPVPNPIPEEQVTGADLFGPGLNAESWDQLRNVDQLDWADAAYSLGEVLAREEERGLRSGFGSG